MNDDRTLKSLGSVIDDTYQRDAVHIATFPCVAGHALSPGDKVYVDRNHVARKAVPTKTHGVVDPFLKFPVASGQMFHMLLNPGSIQSLRHEWGHPDFEDTPKPGTSDKDKKLAAATARLQDLANDAGISYGRLLEGMEEHTNNGDWIHLGTDTPSTYDKVWDDYELVTGKPRKDGEAHFFSCSC